LWKFCGLASVGSTVDVPGSFCLSHIDLEVLAEDGLLIAGLDDSIKANPYISQSRKDFLIGRLPYWNEWARPGPTTYNLGHKE